MSSIRFTPHSVVQYILRFKRTDVSAGQINQGAVEPRLCVLARQLTWSEDEFVEAWTELKTLVKSAHYLGEDVVGCRRWRLTNGGTLVTVAEPNAPNGTQRCLTVLPAPDIRLSLAEP